MIDRLRLSSNAMSSSMQKNVALWPSPTADTTDQTPACLPLTSNWTPQDVGELISSTKLCETCQDVFRAIISAAEGPPRNTTHHASHTSLLQSLQAGCHFCIMIVQNHTEFTGDPGELINMAKSLVYWDVAKPYDHGIVWEQVIYGGNNRGHACVKTAPCESILSPASMKI